MINHLSQVQVTDLMQLLQAQRQSLQLQVDQELHADADPELRVSSTDDTEPSSTPQTDTAIRRAERDTARLEEIDYALAKFSARTGSVYGLCEACAESIGYPRLLAHPAARLCLRCQTASEKSQRRTDNGETVP